jgi:hypothetical protein
MPNLSGRLLFVTFIGYICRTVEQMFDVVHEEFVG